MRKSLRIATFVMASLLFFSYNKLKAQVKIGGDPSVVDKNAVLELESTKKGFLLPRLDLAGFTALKSSGTPVIQGMVVYLKTGAHTDGAGFYFKTGTGNTDADWTKLPDDYAGAGGPWKLSGNANADVNSFIGTTVAQALRFKVNNLDAMSFATDGQLTIPYAHVNTAGAGVNDVLMIGTDGLIQRKDLTQTSVTGLNTLKGDVTLGFPTPSATATAITAAATGQTLNMTFPVMQGTAGQTYGFLTKADWDRIRASANGFSVKDLDPADAAAGAKAAKIDADVTPGNEGKWILSLFPATETNPGVVTTDAQTFAGTKTFDGDIVITNNTTGTAGLTMDGSLKLNAVPANVAAGVTEVDVLVREAGATPNAEVKKVRIDPTRIGNGISAIINGALAATPGTDGRVGFSLTSTGTDLAITPTATNSVEFNIPNASSTARGVITTGDQTIGGKKIFEDSLSVGGTAATSNFNINGSMSVKIRTAPTGATVAVGISDYIVQVAGSATDVAVNIPTASADNLGRMYIIRRIPGTGTDAGIVKIQDDGGKQISSRATIDIDEPYFSVTLISMGTAWEVLSRSATNF